MDKVKSVKMLPEKFLVRLYSCPILGFLQKLCEMFVFELARNVKMLFSFGDEANSINTIQDDARLSIQIIGALVELLGRGVCETFQKIL